jgi:hypothetical protein
MLNGVAPLMQLDPTKHGQGILPRISVRPGARRLGRHSRRSGELRRDRRGKGANDGRREALADKASLLEVGTAAADIANKIGRRHPATGAGGPAA